MMREGLSLLIAQTPELQLVRAVSSDVAAMGAFDELQPAITVLDLDLPNEGAFGVLRHIRASDSHTPVIVLVTYQLDPPAANALACGGRAAVILAKDHAASMLIPLILRLAGL